jgi:hypothetical protein
MFPGCFDVLGRKILYFPEVGPGLACLCAYTLMIGDQVVGFGPFTEYVFLLPPWRTTQGGFHFSVASTQRFASSSFLFSIADLANRVTPKPMFFAKSEVNLSLFRQFDEIWPLMNALLRGRLPEKQRRIELGGWVSPKAGDRKFLHKLHFGFLILILILTFRLTTVIRAPVGGGGGGKYYVLRTYCGQWSYPGVVSSSEKMKKVGIMRKSTETVRAIFSKSLEANRQNHDIFWGER